MWKATLFLLVCLSAMVLLCTANEEREADLKCSERESNGICPMILSPVCGSDGVTYANKCSLCERNAKQPRGTAKVTLRHSGEC
ncbi:serine protease inhibitor Kazal-type 1-like [Styela clava]|uniref:serine protease inhibitor Kazal-type 1-like n=1 Tax=Styela clava TaxID=7725 RepID=UPI00193A425A|nr:serine protease inhibitor Kazal-type 1-like [Styela clava]